MCRAPQQNWKAYEALTRESDAAWIRSLTPQERFELYADLFDLIWNAPRDLEEWGRLERWHWEEKLAIRQRMVEAFAKLDQLRRERAAEKNVG